MSITGLSSRTAISAQEKGADGMTSMMNRKKTAVLLLLVIAAAAAGLMMGNASCRAAEGSFVTCYVLCKPGDYVNVRRTPSTKGTPVGSLEAGDWFETDGESKNGFLRVYGIGEYGEGWIYCGYVSTEEPVEVFERYVCVAKSRVACRRWMGGPHTQNPWLKNGSNVDVFYMTSEWAVTSRGFIRSEWLEADPE